MLLIALSYAKSAPALEERINSPQATASHESHEGSACVNEIILNDRERYKHLEHMDLGLRVGDASWHSPLYTVCRLRCQKNYRVRSAAALERRQQKRQNANAGNYTAYAGQGARQRTQTDLGQRVASAALNANPQDRWRTERLARNQPLNEPWYDFQDYADHRRWSQPYERDDRWYWDQEWGWYQGWQQGWNEGWGRQGWSRRR